MRCWRRSCNKEGWLGGAVEGESVVQDLVVMKRAGQNHLVEVRRAAIFPRDEMVNVASPIGGYAAGHLTPPARSGQ